MQSLTMQVERLEKVVDGIFMDSEGKLGVFDPTTKKALQAVLYLQGLKYDISVLTKK